MSAAPPRAKRENLRRLFVRMARESGYPADEWRRAINVFRLDNAAKRLESHPGLGLVVLDVLRRDRRLEAFAGLLG